MEKKEKKQTKKFSKILGLLVPFLVGGIFGILAAKSGLRHDTSSGNLQGTGLMLLVFGVSMLLSIFLHVIIHEAGHLVGGLLSGYQFASFRIGSMIFVKQNGEIKRKKYSIMGTGGQCLMTPPDMVDGKIPYVLYNLSGSFANSLVSTITLLLLICIPTGRYFSEFLLIMTFLGYVLAIVNGFPMRLGAIDNDGNNAKNLGKNKEALRSFWSQLKMNSLITNNIRLKDMPDELFELPSKEAMVNPLCASTAVFAGSRAMDMHQFDLAREIASDLLNNSDSLISIYRCCVMCDALYLELIGENRKEMIEKYYGDKELQQFMKGSKTNLSVIRTQYAYERLYLQREENAQKKRAFFEKIVKTYPYEGEIISEREFLTIIDAVVKEREEMIGGNR